ncbi:uncharacterized protein LOC143914541 [Arctopsyche grandis]|uniref:uncharacterized protein LOC143914541 n=1 Tax=Arctopsyche grandis TaxID=121162 RepID=UPI00406D896D
MCGCTFYFLFHHVNDVLTALPVGMTKTKLDEKGRYILKIKYLEKCLSLRSPIDTERMVDYSIVMKKYNDTDFLITTNVHVPKKVKLVKVLYLPVFWKPNGNFTSVIKASNDPCGDVILITLLRLFVPIDSTCSLKNGNYSVKDINVNGWAHRYFNNYIYARLQAQLEYYTEFGLVFCLDALIDITPASPMTGVVKMSRKKKRITYK